MRLAKYLAHAGVASRRAAEELDRRRAASPSAARSSPTRRATSTTRSDVARRRRAGRASCRATASSTRSTSRPASSRPRSDTHGRPTVVDLVARRGARLYPVGRLDADTTGLILLTNDGELANRLTHPRYEVPKTYRAARRRRAGAPSARCARCARASSSTTAGPRRRRCASSRPGVLELTIHEGRKRQVERMCEAVGHPVRRARARRASGRCALGRPARPGAGAARARRRAEVERARAAPRRRS